MIQSEPVISIGILSEQKTVHVKIHGSAQINNGKFLSGAFQITKENGMLNVISDEGQEGARAANLSIVPKNDSTLSFYDVVIGKQFHWERKEIQQFSGSFRIVPDGENTFCVINDIGVEQYLASVVSSEMRSSAPFEFLKAHAITSRSWLLAMLRKKQQKSLSPQNNHLMNKSFKSREGEIIRWYDREDHRLFDVCADDHCQRYQGMTKDIGNGAGEAVRQTRGMALMYGDEICDARFHKACGGRTEEYSTSWEDVSYPYLVSVVDGEGNYPLINTEAAAREWFSQSPVANCNVDEKEMLGSLLPSFDQETTDFFRWIVTYSREELEELFFQKGGVDVGRLIDIEPLQRGSSGRIVRLKIIGTNRQVILGKELEIRKWFSPSHLYSSGFLVNIARDERGIPTTITLRGGGWGHGVGMCQIGGAVMAARGYRAEQILAHYFRGAIIKSLY